MTDGLMSTNIKDVQSLQHFSFLLFQVDCVLDLENLRIPQLCQTLFRPNSEFVSAEAGVFVVFFLIYVAVHTVVNNVPVTHRAKSARHNSYN